MHCLHAQWCLTLSVQFNHSVVSKSLRPHGLQHTRPPCPSPTPGVCPHSRPLSGWCHPTISSSVVIPSSSCLQSFPSSGSFPMSRLLIMWPKYWSFSISPSNEYSGLTSFRMDCWIYMLSKGLSRVFSNTTAQKHQFFGTQFSFWSIFMIWLYNFTWMLFESNFFEVFLKNYFWLCWVFIAVWAFLFLWPVGSSF